MLFIGDSMTGWLSERFNAYGQKNGFTVSAIIWDGATIRRYGQLSKLKAIIDKENPDVVFISLGLNELLERNPQKLLDKPMDRIIEAVADRQLVWIRPPSWPGKGKGSTLVDWLTEKVGSGNYFNSTDLELKRQGKSNPHPTRESVVQWTDSIVEWLADKPETGLNELVAPERNDMSRGRSYRHIPMKKTP